MARYYWGSLFIGLMIFETACSLNFIISRILERHSSIRHRLFHVCVFTTLVFIPHNCTSAAVADFMITLPEFMARLSPTELTKYFMSIALPGLYCSVLESCGLVYLLFLRSKTLPDLPKWYRIYMVTFPWVIVLGCITVAVLVPFVFGLGLRYTQHPLFPIYLMAHGLIVGTGESFHITLTTIMFLYQIYKVKKYTFSKFLFDWIVHRDGVRYVILWVLNIFNVFAFFQTVLVGQNDVNAQLFHASAFAKSMCLFMFMNDSYQTAVDVIQEQGSGGKSTLTTKPGFALTTVSPSVVAAPVSSPSEHSVE